MVGQIGSHANVDFAYTGPPVVVSNGQALDLVRQFGVQNAWYAYLKLRGMSLSKEEAEKAVALKKFRNKIRRLKKAAENLKDRRADFDLFLNKEFSTFLEPYSLEIRKDEGSASEESDGKEDSPMLGENGGEIPTTSASLPGLQVIQTAAPSVGANDICMDTFQKLPVTLDNPEKNRQHETIDDVVSSIMDKIRNNLPFEGELSASSTSTQPPVSRAPKKMKNTKKPNEAVFVPAPQVASADQVTILSNFSEIIRASTSKQTRTDAQQMPMGAAPTAQFPTTFTLPFANMNLSAITGQGITLPNNLTVQALLQSIQQQAKKAQMVQQQETLPDSSSQDIVLHHQDSSSNLAPVPAPSAQPAKKRQPAKKKPEKMSLAETACNLEANTPVAQPKEEVTNALTADKKPGKKNKKSVKPEDNVKVEPKSTEEDLKRIAELESQLRKCQKQLAAEKNKSSNQKKRLEKLQSDLEKSTDAIQLVQIDLACQKTDNNNLTAENIALKAENQQLRSKDSSSKTSTRNKSKTKPVETFSTAKTTKSASAKRGRKARSPSPVNQKVDSIPEPIEYGRRTSKRICVSRTRLLYGLI